MTTRLGGTLEGVITAVVAVVALGALGYTAFTGNCVSCVFTGDGAAATTVASTEPTGGSCAIKSRGGSPVVAQGTTVAATESEDAKVCPLTGCSEGEMAKGEMVLASGEGEAVTESSCCPFDRDAVLAAETNPEMDDRTSVAQGDEVASDDGEG